MSASQDGESFSVRGKGGSTMRLPLHSAGDRHGNAFPVSSSSSSSTSSFLGESSPESLRSLSSLSEGRTDSPTDDDMFEVTLTTTVMARMDKGTDVVSNWTPKEDREAGENGSVPIGKIQAAIELSESTENSLSVYLDTNSCQYCQDPWDNNNKLTLATHSCNSSTLDSDATEVPADEEGDDEEEEEALFHSVCSEPSVQRSSLTEFQTDGTDDSESPELWDRRAGPPATGCDREPIQTPVHTSTAQDSKEVASSEEPERGTVGFKPTRLISSQPTRTAKPKTMTASSASPKTTAYIRPSSGEVKRASKPDLKNVKAKVSSWPTPSPPKPSSQQNTSAPANGKKAVPTREDAQCRDAGRSQRSSADQVKATVMLRPNREKICDLRTNHKTRGSDVDEGGFVNTSRKAVQEVADHQHGAETTHPDAHAGEECGEEEPAEGSGNVVGKQSSYSKKVSSKLGPNARQHGKGNRADKASGSAPPPGSGAGPPGQGHPGPRHAQRDGSVSREAEQHAGGGSATRVKQTQSQSEGTVPGPVTPIVKPAANQQQAGGSAGRPVVATASKLPVKGLSTNLNSPSLGSNDNSGSTSRGTQASESPSQNICPVSSQNVAKPPSTRAAPSTCTPSDTVSSPHSGVTAPPKPPLMRTRALSLQARTATTGMKTPSATNHSTSKMTAVSHTAGKAAPPTNQALTRQASLYPLQRSNSTRLSRLNSPVDKNKPREAPARPTNANSSSKVTSGSGGQNQNEPQTPSDLVPEAVNAKSSGTPVRPVLVPEVTNPGSGTTGASGPGFKARAGSRSCPKTGSRIQNASRSGVVRASTAAVDGTTVTAKQSQSKEQAEKKNQAINQLRRLLAQGNKKVEALATVIQHLFTEREEALKQKKELLVELATLRDELVASSQCCEHLRKEREEVCHSMEEALRRLEEQHREELVQLEDRLRSFYQTEWDKVHQVYQEEADKCRMLMEQQVEELRRKQETERKNQEVSHNQQMESLKQQHETSIQELKSIQQTELENLEKTLMQTQTSLSEKLSELSAEKEALNERLKEEEEKRNKILTDKNLKNSHTVYLEQELESLKVVLEIKNSQLHQKEKKLMDMDKLVETNVKLEECLKKVQQENEDYKARMDKHAALSKQLSNEQAKLQQTLQKESKVNKRLSMENEELLWKLHNGDLLASPRRLSPTSPFNSPRNSASFPSTAPVSPR